MSDVSREATRRFNEAINAAGDTLQASIEARTDALLDELSIAFDGITDQVAANITEARQRIDLALPDLPKGHPGTIGFAETTLGFLPRREVKARYADFFMTALQADLLLPRVWNPADSTTEQDQEIQEIFDAINEPVALLKGMPVGGEQKGKSKRMMIAAEGSDVPTTMIIEEGLEKPHVFEGSLVGVELVTIPEDAPEHTVGKRMPCLVLDSQADSPLGTVRDHFATREKTADVGRRTWIPLDGIFIYDMRMINSRLPDLGTKPDPNNPVDILWKAKFAPRNEDGTYVDPDLGARVDAANYELELELQA